MSTKWYHSMAPSGCRHGWKQDWKKDNGNSWGGGGKRSWGGDSSDCGWKSQKSHCDW